MRLALLNLPYDNNYGGNLQRYALVRVLESMGHEVVHINLRRNYELPWYKKPYSYTKRGILKYIFGKNIRVNLEAYKKRRDKQLCIETEKFYNKYIKHTDACYTIEDVIKATKGRFDAFIVGSDQVWRKDMTGSLGIKNYFLEFTKDWDVKRIAYAVSVGKDSPDYSEHEVEELSQLYGAFDAVSVRESCLLRCFENYGWIHPKAETLLDPTLLLDEACYNELISAADTESKTKGKIYCYILDQTADLISYIEHRSKELECEYVVNDLSNIQNPVSIEQWLRNIRDAKCVITDSYHGSVFSIIFSKKFEYRGNSRRGNTRIKELFKIIGFNGSDLRDIKYVNTSLNLWRDKTEVFFQGLGL